MKTLILLCTLLIGTASARADEGNLLKNPALEGNGLPDEWTLADAGELTPGEISQDSDAGQNGQSCLRIVHPPGGGHYTQIRQAVPVTPGAKYVLRARVKSENLSSNPDGGLAQVGLFDAVGNTMASKRVDTQGGWVDVELPIEVADQTTAQVLIYLDVTEGSFWVENVSLTLAP
jgi:hypothetical protein